MKKFLLPIIALAALVFGLISVVRSQPQHDSTEPPSAPPVSPYAHTVAASGIVEASTENIAIGTPMSDIVASVFVSVGQRVKAGDPLFELDDRQRRADLEARRADKCVAESHVKVDEALLREAASKWQVAQRIEHTGAVSEDELTTRRAAADTAQARLDEDKALVASAAAQIQVTEAQLARSIVRASVDGDVLQVKIHPGEFAQAGAGGGGATAAPLVLLGGLKPLYVRVNVDETDAWRIKPEAQAIANVRGNPRLKTPLYFIRFEPFIIPKQSLTGDSTERVDTRVLQVIYRVEDDTLPLFVGQQLDVFIQEKGSGIVSSDSAPRDRPLRGTGLPPGRRGSMYLSDFSLSLIARLP